MPADVKKCVWAADVEVNDPTIVSVSAKGVTKEDAEQTAAALMIVKLRVSGIAILSTQEHSCPLTMSPIQLVEHCFIYLLIIPTATQIIMHYPLLKSTLDKQHGTTSVALYALRDCS